MGLNKQVLNFDSSLLLVFKLLNERLLFSVDSCKAVWIVVRVGLYKILQLFKSVFLALRNDRKNFSGVYAIYR